MVLSLLTLIFIKSATINKDGISFNNGDNLEWDEIRKIRFLPFGLFYITVNGNTYIFPSKGYILHFFGIIIIGDSMYDTFKSYGKMAQ